MAAPKDWRKKSNKEDFAFPTYRVNLIELTVNTKVATPYFHINYTFSGLLPFLVKNFEPPLLPVTQFLEGPPPFNKRGREGFLTMGINKLIIIICCWDFHLISLTSCVGKVNKSHLYIKRISQLQTYHY